MRFSTLHTFVTAAVLASASPIRVARQASPTDPGLFFLSVLEFGAVGFYQGLVEAFNGTDYQGSGFANGQAVFDIVNTISNSELTHLTILQNLSGAPLPNCTLDFSPAYADPITGLATAGVLEFAAIGAYVGVIASETTSNNTQIFAEIMGNEARHQETLGLLLQRDSFPDSFELGMTPVEVLTLLLPFNPSCDPPLPLTPNAPLSITNSGPITNTTTLTFDLSGAPCANQTGLFCQLITGNDATAEVIPIENCTLTGLDGGVMVFVTNDSTAISADPLQRSSIPNLCAGPAITFVSPATSPGLDALLLQPTSSSNSTA